MACRLQAALLAAALLACLGAAAAAPAGPYKCDPKTCKLPECACGATAAMGVDGVPLKPEDTPQFIILTHDDSITRGTNAGMRAIMDNHKNSNGCNMPATFFVLEKDTDCELAVKFWEENSELAIHSKTHIPLNASFPEAVLKDEMTSARKWLNESCGIPLEDLVGYRTPLLQHFPGVRAMLEQEGFLYDSSIPENTPSASSPNDTRRLWPYTMDAGIPQDCAFFRATCEANESYPGLWEIPLLAYEDANGTLVGIMDPGLQVENLAMAMMGGGANQTAQDAMTSETLEQLLKVNFERSYKGNRAPFGLYVHSPWLTRDLINGTNAFLKYALAQPDVWAVTNKQLLEWMADPVPASEMDQWLSCKPTNITAPALPGAVKCQVHTVASGDTGGQVSAIYGATLAELAAANPGKQLESLAVGDKLNIPPWGPDCKAKDAAAAPAKAPGATA